MAYRPAPPMPRAKPVTEFGGRPMHARHSTPAELGRGFAEPRYPVAIVAIVMFAILVLTVIVGVACMVRRPW